MFPYFRKKGVKVLREMIYLQVLVSIIFSHIFPLFVALSFPLCKVILMGRPQLQPVVVPNGSILAFSLEYIGYYPKYYLLCGYLPWCMC